MTVQTPVMTSANLGTLFTLLGAASAVSAITLTGIAWLARLRFCSQIEAIRDDAADAVLDGRLRHEGAVAAYLAALDSLTWHPRRAALAAITAVLPGLLADGQTPAPPQACRDLTAAEQHIIGDLQARARAAITSYLNWSPATSLVLCVRRGAPGRRP